MCARARRLRRRFSYLLGFLYCSQLAKALGACHTAPLLRVGSHTGASWRVPSGHYLPYLGGLPPHIQLVPSCVSNTAFEPGPFRHGLIVNTLLEVAQCDGSERKPQVPCYVLHVVRDAPLSRRLSKQCHPDCCVCSIWCCSRKFFTWGPNVWKVQAGHTFPGSRDSPKRTSYVLSHVVGDLCRPS
jgi:hypothetical protein